MVKDEADKPGVIAPPPFIYLFFLLLGLAIDFAWPLAVLPQVKPICDVAAPAMLMYQFHPGSKYHSLDLLSHRLHSNVRLWPN